MHPELITRVVNLIQKNGDKVVLADPTTGKAVVVMDLEAYEALCAVQPAIAQPVAATPAVTAPAPMQAAPAMQPVMGPRVAPSAPAAFVPTSQSPVTAAPEAVAVPPKMTPRIPVIEVQKMTHFSEIPPKKKPVKVTPETMGVTHVMADLTQEELIDKINRDIGAWKTAQDRRRTDELKSAAKVVPQLEVASALEEEERFYLEPIE